MAAKKNGRVRRIFRRALPVLLALPLAWSASTVATQVSPPAPTPPAIRIAETSGLTVAAGQTYFAGATTHTFEADEAAVHPMIASAARRLQNDPDRIYEFVRNAVETEPTFGLQKGAVGTLAHRSGTPFDQADLMIKLLRAAGYTARFRYGPVTLTAQQFLDWQGTNDATAVRRLLNDGGFPNDVAGTTTITSATFLSVWVEAQIGGQWYEFDPAFKENDWYAPADFKTLMGYNRTSVRTAAGAFTATGTVPQVSATYAGQLTSTLTGYATTLSNALSGATYAQKSSEEVLGGHRVRPVTRTAQRLAALAYAPLGSSVTWDEAPDRFRTKITVTGYPLSGSSVSVIKYGDSHYADLFRMSATAPAAPPNFLWLDIASWGSQCQGGCTGLETLPYDTIAVTVDHPYAAGAGAYADKTYATKTSSGRNESAGGSSLYTTVALRGIWLSLGRDTDRGLELYQRQAATNQFCMSLGWPFTNGYCNFSAKSDPALANVARAARLAEGVGNARIANHHALAFSFYTQSFHDWTNQQWTPPYNQNYTHEGGEVSLVSIQSEVSVTARSGLAADRTAAIAAHATLFQAAESIGVAQSVKRDTPQDMWAEYAATGSTNRFVWITAANYNTAKNQLTGYTDFGGGTLKLARIQEFVNAGYTVLAAKSGSIGPTLLPNLKSAAFWAISPAGDMAAVYVEPGSQHIAMKGAAGSRPTNGAKPPGLSSQFMDEFNRGVFDPSGAISVDGQSGLGAFASPTLLSTGSGEFPRRMDFRLKFSGEPTNNPLIMDDQGSPRLAGNGSFVGWASLGARTVYTSLEHDLSMGEDLGLAFGDRAPGEAVQAVTAAVVSMEEVKAGTDALSGLVLMGAQAWLGHQLEDGVATIVHGVDGIEKFVRKPDGTWRAPPDTLEALTQTGNPSFVPPFNRRGYRGVTFLWRGRDGTTKSFREPLPGTATGDAPLTSTEISNCAATGATAFEKAYWGVGKAFVMDTWTLPGGEWVKAEHIAASAINPNTPTRCSTTSLKRLKNNYGRYIEFSYSSAVYGEDVPYVSDDTGRSVQIMNMPMFAQLTPGYMITNLASSASTTYELGFKLPDGQKLWMEADQCRGAYKSPYALPRQYCDRMRLFLNDPNTPLQTVVMDPNDAAVQSIDDGDGVTTSYAVMPGYRFAVTDEAGATSATTYDRDGRTLESLSPGGKLKTYAYDGRGRVTDEKLSLASAPTVFYGWTSYLYDTEGRRTDTIGHAWTDPATGQPYSTTNLTSQTVWNTTWNKPAIQRDARGKETAFTYSATNGLLTQVDGPSGERSITEYDALGRVYRTRSLVRSSPSVVERVTQFGYDAKGNLTTTTLNPSGASPLITTLGYDAIGNLTSVVNPRGYTTTATYDTLRRLTQVDGASGSQVVMIYGGNGKLYRAEQKTSDPNKPAVMTWDYLPSGRVRAMTDPESRTTVYTYDSVGRIRYVDDPDGRRTETTYTADSEVQTTTGGVGTPTASTLSMVYYPDGGVRFQRDGLFAQTTQEFGTVENLRDSWGRPAGIRYGAGGQYETVVRDAAGNITQARIRDAAPASGGTDRYITFTYDNSNRQLTKTAPTTTAGQTLTTTNVYDLAGGLLSATFTDSRVPGTTQRLGYAIDDATGRLTSETWWERYGTTTGLTTGYEYDPNGNRTAIVWPDAYKATYLYDTEDRMTQVGWQRPGGSSGTFATFTPNPQGQVASVAYANGVTATFDRLTSGPMRQINYSFPGSGPLTLAYGYNNSLQQTFEQASDATFAWKPTAPEVTTTFSALTQPGQAVNLYNQYEQATVTTAGVPATMSWSHDPRGNLTSDGTRIFIYDYENRMERVTTTGGTEVVRYDYDPAGRRSIKALYGGARTAFVHAGAAEIADVDPSTYAVLRRYIPGAGTDSWVAFVDEQASGATKYVHQNKLGSVIALSDAAGAVAAADRFTYDPYGNSPSATGGFPFRFTGQRLDPETGLYYYRARYYDPRIGRFMQTDPIGVSGGVNLYGYVGGDPVNFRDPLGLKNCPIEDPSCVETPESASKPEEPPADSEDDNMVEGVVVTAAATGETSNGSLIRADGEDEQAFIIQYGQIYEVPMPQRTVVCPPPQGEVKMGLPPPIPPGGTPAHSHTNGLEGYPGPGDGAIAKRADSHTSYVITSERVFQIKFMPNGTFRTRISGPPLDAYDQGELVSNMQGWEKPASRAGSGAPLTDQQRACRP